MFKVIRRSGQKANYTAISVVEQDGYMFIMSPGLRKTTHKFQTKVLDKGISGAAADLVRKGYKGAQLNLTEDYEVVATCTSIEDAVDVVSSAYTEETTNTNNPIDEHLVGQYFSNEKTLKSLAQVRDQLGQSKESLNTLATFVRSISGKLDAFVNNLNKAAEAKNLKAIQQIEGQINEVLKVLSKEEKMKALLAIAGDIQQPEEEFDAKAHLGL